MLFKNICKCFLSLFVVVSLFSANNSIVDARNNCYNYRITHIPENFSDRNYRPILREFSVRVLNWATEGEKHDLNAVLERGLNQEEFWYRLEYSYNCSGIYSLWLFQQLECLLDVSAEGSVLYSNLLPICSELKAFIRRRYPMVAPTYFDIYCSDQLILTRFAVLVLNWATAGEKSRITEICEKGLDQEELWYCLDSVYHFEGIYSLWLFHQFGCILDLSAEGSVLHSNLLPVYNEFKAFIIRRYPEISQIYFEQNCSIESVLQRFLCN